VPLYGLMVSTAAALYVLYYCWTVHMQFVCQAAAVKLANSYEGLTVHINVYDFTLFVALGASVPLWYLSRACQLQQRRMWTLRIGLCLVVVVAHSLWISQRTMNKRWLWLKNMHSTRNVSYLSGVKHTVKETHC